MPERRIIYVDMDDVLCDYSGAHRRAVEEQPKITYPQSVPGFFEQLQPIDGAIEAVRRLSTDSDVFVLSAPSTRNPLSYTEKRVWVETHFDYDLTKRLILCPDKGLLQGHFLIDDHVSGKGQERFQGEVIQFGSQLFPNWRAVMEYLSSQGVTV
ncbi:MAG: hypothetical protein RIC12_02090 [Pirellulales bacterium]